MKISQDELIYYYQEFPYMELIEWLEKGERNGVKNPILSMRFDNFSNIFVVIKKSCWGDWQTAYKDSLSDCNAFHGRYIFSTED